MQKEYASLRRQPFLAPVWIFGLIGLLALAVAGWAIVKASTTVVVVMRHAEKVAAASADPPLSEAGLARAQRLAETFGATSKALAIDAIFVTQWQRTAATALPLATRLGVPVLPVAAEDVPKLVTRILDEYRGRRVLVIAHSDTVAAIVKELARDALIPEIGEHEYGTLYVVAVPRWSRPIVLGMRLP